MLGRLVVRTESECSVLVARRQETIWWGKVIVNPKGMSKGALLWLTNRPEGPLMCPQFFGLWSGRPGHYPTESGLGLGLATKTSFLVRNRHYGLASVRWQRAGGILTLLIPVLIKIMTCI